MNEPTNKRTGKGSSLVYHCRPCSLMHASRRNTQLRQLQGGGYAQNDLVVIIRIVFMLHPNAADMVSDANNDDDREAGDYDTQTQFFVDGVDSWDGSKCVLAAMLNVKVLASHARAV